MEPLVPAFVLTADPGLVHVLGGVLSVLALTATAVVLAGTMAERNRRLLTFAAGACVAFSGLLAAAGFLGLVARWAFAVACVACLLALLALALRYGQGTSLEGYLKTGGGEEGPGWWPAFERGFHRYANGPRREQNPLRRAVTRPRSHTPAADGQRAAKRFPDIMTGGRP
jgi:hypothetical protein